MSKDFMLRLVELIKEDPELRLALLDAITQHARANKALADWRNRRK